MTAGIFVIFNESFTGGPRVAVNLAVNLKRLGLCPVVLTNRQSRISSDLQQLDISCEIVSPPSAIDRDDHLILSGGFYRRARAAMNVFGYNLRIRGTLKKLEIEVLWVRNIKGIILVAPAAFLSRIPIIWDIGMEKKSVGLVKLLHIFGLLISSLVVAEGESVYREMFSERIRSLFRRKLRVVPGGIDQDLAARLERREIGRSRESPFCILCVASIVPRKNQIFALQVLKRLVAQRPNVRLVFVGPANDGDYLKLCKEYAESCGLTPFIAWEGWQDDVVPFMEGADAMLLCSTNEGVPYAVIEAMHGGVPVIASKVGGIPDIINDGENGFIFEPNDETAALQALLRYIDSEDLRQRIATDARRIVQEVYSAGRWSSEYAQIMRELAK